ncbi:MAG: UDP-N-acetylmuramoyl-L-alanine--D-glutamate ligase [Planctomycetota bacterium]
MSDTPPQKLNGPPHLATARLALLKDWRGKRVTVMGLGWHGGQIAAIKYLARRGARLTVTDLLDESELADSLAALDGYAIDKFVLGRHDEDDFRTAEAVVVAPAVKPGNRFVRLAAEAGALITSEIELAIAETPGPLIGITGTVGKSTTATMCRDMLVAGGKRARLVGNIGESLLDAVDDPADKFSAEDVTVFELSSYQLVRLAAADFRPDVAAVTNLYVHHAEWHGSEANYIEAKRSIFDRQGTGDVAITSMVDIGSRLPRRGLAPMIDTPAVRFRTNVTPLQSRRSLFLRRREAVLAAYSREGGRPMTFRVPERDWPSHMWSDATMAALVAWSAGAGRRAIARGVRDFEILPHRSQTVATIEGVHFIDDSKATSLAALSAAVATAVQMSGMNKDAVKLICGGGSDLAVRADDAGHPHSPASVFGQVSSVAAFGRYGRQLKDTASVMNQTEVSLHESLEEAFVAATRNLVGSRCVIFSPGCPSRPIHRDFKERGEHFRRLVEQYRRRVEGSP